MGTAKRVRPNQHGTTAEVVERERQVLQLRLEGWTFDAIAQRLGYKTPSGAHMAYKSALKRTLQQPADEIREAELARLDELQKIAWQQVLSGDLRAVDSVLRIMDRRAKFLGLDSPHRIEAKVETTNGSDIDTEVARLAALLDSGKPRVVDAPASESEPTTA